MPPSIPIPRSIPAPGAAWTDRPGTHPFAALSGGQKQRLFLALALVHDPRLLFLDELTTGLDPHARRTVWDLIRSVRARGKTILLSTHLMEEAEELCDRIAVFHQGRIVALDTPSRLIARVVGGLRIVLRIPDGTPCHRSASFLAFAVSRSGIKHSSSAPMTIGSSLLSSKPSSNTASRCGNFGFRAVDWKMPTLSSLGPHCHDRNSESYVAWFASPGENSYCSSVSHSPPSLPLFSHRCSF